MAADFFKCDETIEAMAKIWIEAIKISVPTAYSDQLKHWILISFIFKCFMIFKRATRIAMQGLGSFITESLPAPDQFPESVAGT
jgi:hypothetical protein